ncbi:MAG: PIN domain-containing protein [Acidobacteriota bacterium]
MSLVDTSVWVDFLRKDGHPPSKTKARHLLAADEAIVTDPIIFELLHGCRSKQAAILTDLFETIETKPWKEGFWEAAAELGRRVMGRERQRRQVRQERQ